MDIDALTKEEAPDDNEHDKAYAHELRKYHQWYRGFSEKELEAERKSFGTYNNTHWDTARRVVSYRILMEMKRKKG